MVCKKERPPDSQLADKIAKLHTYFSLLKPNITDEERHHLDATLVECYKNFGITFDNASLYDESGNMKPMPDQSDLYKILRQKPETKGLATAQARFVTGSAANLGRQTNVDLDNKYIVLDISEKPQDLLPLGLLDEEPLQFIHNRRGEGLLCAGHNRISVAFQPTQMEYDMITTSRSDLEEQMQRNEQAARG